MLQKVLTVIKYMIRSRYCCTPQEMFDMCIRAGVYDRHSDHMCFSLDEAYCAGILSHLEISYAKECINNYIAPHSSLRVALLESGLPYHFKDRLAIYKDWSNRPKLKRSFF